ncbi:hypothetical protein PTSG_03897 [Salpingoeca rosetta]|uniref:C2H2-type domain-containing protein n=1 Tax=Salpingoeca rosetta (strain ATCC 50818 / BSB-021) TaxID=946362 RepID=F2U770_SALR5|nr:uncharacterized protein PTSG_03897 [Salpingoeca rosetta]EGD83287.1 hypothetical protein PTSG_03897 [Salpingoeca rosetta]|eukprot:XP_004994791.1 hypothetical protein PTSG_03897 [Salpingoeca rosetta]
MSSAHTRLSFRQSIEAFLCAGIEDAGSNGHTRSSLDSDSCDEIALAARALSTVQQLSEGKLHIPTAGSITAALFDVIEDEDKSTHEQLHDQEQQQQQKQQNEREQEQEHVSIPSAPRHPVSTSAPYASTQDQHWITTAITSTSEAASTTSTSPSSAEVPSLNLAELSGFSASQLQEVSGRHVPGSFEVGGKFYVIKGTLTSHEELSAYRQSKSAMTATTSTITSPALAAATTTTNGSSTSTSTSTSVKSEVDVSFVASASPSHSTETKGPVNNTDLQDPRLAILRRAGRPVPGRANTTRSSATSTSTSAPPPSAGTGTKKRRSSSKTAPVPRELRGLQFENPGRRSACPAVDDEWVCRCTTVNRGDIICSACNSPRPRTTRRSRTPSTSASSSSSSSAAATEPAARKPGADGSSDSQGKPSTQRSKQAMTTATPTAAPTTTTSCSSANDESGPARGTRAVKTEPTASASKAAATATSATTTTSNANKGDAKYANQVACISCRRVFTHLQRHLSRSSKCQLALRRRDAAVVRHRQNAGRHNTNLTSCVLCGEAFASTGDLQVHLKGPDHLRRAAGVLTAGVDGSDLFGAPAPRPLGDTEPEAFNTAIDFGRSASKLWFEFTRGLHVSGGADEADDEAVTHARTSTAAVAHDASEDPALHTQQPLQQHHPGSHTAAAATDNHLSKRRKVAGNEEATSPPSPPVAPADASVSTTTAPLQQQQQEELYGVAAPCAGAGVNQKISFLCRVLTAAFAPTAGDGGDDGDAHHHHGNVEDVIHLLQREDTQAAQQSADLQVLRQRVQQRQLALVQTLASLNA